VVLLAGGLLALLVLNMTLAQDAFQVTQLQQTASQLQNRQEALAQSVERLADPERLASKAHDLGMVPSENPVFIRLHDGKVLGVPAPGGPSDVTAVTQPTMPAPPTTAILPTTVPGRLARAAR
jgi:hypothetical protein